MGRFGREWKEGGRYAWGGIPPVTYYSDGLFFGLTPRFGIGWDGEDGPEEKYAKFDRDDRMGVAACRGLWRQQDRLCGDERGTRAAAGGCQASAFAGLGGYWADRFRTDYRGASGGSFRAERWRPGETVFRCAGASESG